MLDKERVGKIIAYYRKKKGLTQKELADMLHISYQAVSKWEVGIGLPTVEMFCAISSILNVSLDVLLNENTLDDRQITFMDAGLDVDRLYQLKEDVVKLASKDERLLSANYADAVLFQMNTSGMKDPVYVMLNCVPGSKEKIARERGYDKEICADVATSGMHFILQHGAKPVILKAQIICGNANSEQIYHMAQAFREVCEENGVMFAGMEISMQPVNYRVDEYQVSAILVGVQDREKLITGEEIREGDVLIGIQTDGMDGTQFPILKVMVDRKPELVYGTLYGMVDDRYSIWDEVMKPRYACVKEVEALQEAGCLHGIFRIKMSLLQPEMYSRIPEGLGACIQLEKISVPPLHRFLQEQDLIGRNSFPYYFHFGIGMVLVVPEDKCEQALSILRQSRNALCIGMIEKDEEHPGEKAWPEGKILW